jgi:hypothetical protein
MIRSANAFLFSPIKWVAAIVLLASTVSLSGDTFSRQAQREEASTEWIIREKSRRVPYPFNTSAVVDRLSHPTPPAVEFKLILHYRAAYLRHRIRTLENHKPRHPLITMLRKHQRQSNFSEEDPFPTGPDPAL